MTKRTRIAESARALYETHGTKAEAQAVQKAKRLEREGDIEGAADWRAIREVVREMRGAPQS